MSLHCHQGPHSALPCSCCGREERRAGERGKNTELKAKVKRRSTQRAETKGGRRAAGLERDTAAPGGTPRLGISARAHVPGPRPVHTISATTGSAPGGSGFLHPPSAYPTCEHPVAVSISSTETSPALTQRRHAPCTQACSFLLLGKSNPASLGPYRCVVERQNHLPAAPFLSVLKITRRQVQANVSPK